MADILSPVAVQDFFVNGVPATGGKLFAYQAGTTTKITTFSDAGGTAQVNPIVMNSRGEPQNNSGASVGIWVNATGGSYKLVFAPSTDTDPPTNPIWTVDNIAPVQASTVFFDLPFEFLGDSPPVASEAMGMYVAARSQRFYANFNGGSLGGAASYGACLVNPTAEVDITVFRNAAETIGSITVSTGGVFSFATAGGVSFDLTAGEFIWMQAPASPDATFANATWSLTGYDL